MNISKCPTEALSELILLKIGSQTFLNTVTLKVVTSENKGGFKIE
jgi:hypothetical protein